VAGRYARERVGELGVELVLKSGDPSLLVAALRRSAEQAATGVTDTSPS
jgi:hypothetical protein